MNSQVKIIYNQYVSKYYKSIYLYIILSILSFALSAGIIILNLFAIRYNPGKASNDANLKLEFLLFVIISIIAAVQGLVGSVIALFSFKTKISNLKQMNEQIKNELDNFKKNEQEYLNEKNKELLLVKKIRNILINS